MVGLGWACVRTAPGSGQPLGQGNPRARPAALGQKSLSGPGQPLGVRGQQPWPCQSHVPGQPMGQASSTCQARRWPAPGVERPAAPGQASPNSKDTIQALICVLSGLGQPSHTGHASQWPGQPLQGHISSRGDIGRSRRLLAWPSWGPIHAQGSGMACGTGLARGWPGIGLA